jgi:hypothetical protein
VIIVVTISIFTCIISSFQLEKSVSNTSMGQNKVTEKQLRLAPRPTPQSWIIKYYCSVSLYNLALINQPNDL